MTAAVEVAKTAWPDAQHGGGDRMIPEGGRGIYCRIIILDKLWTIV